MEIQMGLDGLVSLHKISVLSSGCIERSDSKLAKAEIGAFTEVNAPEDKHHEEVGRYRQTLINDHRVQSPYYQR